MLKAKARWGFSRIVVDDCPYCHRTHYHSAPVGEGARMADCFKGEYLLDFEAAQQSVQATCSTCGEKLRSGDIWWNECEKCHSKIASG